jgi:hypothetical protein
MHLLVCMKMFDANIVTRTLVITAQLTMTPFLMAMYIIKPGALHRFVGYLEETAVETYSNIVQHVETPGTHLHTSWATLLAPDIAKNYWALQPDATWHECLRHMLADEAHHRSGYLRASNKLRAHFDFLLLNVSTGLSHLKGMSIILMRSSSKTMRTRLSTST